MNESGWGVDATVYLHVHLQSREPCWVLVVATASTGAPIGLTGIA
jgi:hypothetical protein